MRVAIVPAGNISDARFRYLAGYVASLDNFSVSALPRRALSTPRSLRNLPRSESKNEISTTLPRSSSFGHSRSDSVSLPIAHDLSLATNGNDHAPKSSNRNGVEVPDLPVPHRQSSVTISTLKAASVDGRTEATGEFLSQSSGLTHKRSYSFTRQLRKLNRSSHSRPNVPPSLPLASPSRGGNKESSFISMNSQLLTRDSEDITASDTEAVVKLRYIILHRDRSGSLLKLPSSEWDDFHTQRTWGVIGIVDFSTKCGKAGTTFETFVQRAKEEFAASRKDFVGACVWRLIVFSSDGDQASDFVCDVPLGPGAAEYRGKSKDAFPQARKDENRTISIGRVQGTHDSNEIMKEVKAQITDFASLVLAAIEDWMEDFRSSSKPIASPLDNKRNPDSAKLVKRQPGRFDKIQGDYFLLTGSPGKAYLSYHSAAEKARSSQDRLWTAGATEGMCAALVWKHIENGEGYDDYEIVVQVVEHYKAINRLYEKKKAARLEIGAAMRLAEYLGACSNQRYAALQAASDASHVIETSMSLTAAERAMLWENLANFCFKLSAKRKASYFLHRLAEHRFTEGKHAGAVALHMTCLSLSPDHTVPDLRRSLLLIAAKAATVSHNYATAASNLVKVLCLSPSLMRRHSISDEEVLHLLLELDVPTTLKNIKKLLDLVQLHPLQHKSLVFRMPTLPSAIKKIESGSGGIFLFNPYDAGAKAISDAAARQIVTWVCGELATISFTLFNRLTIPVRLDIISVIFHKEGSLNRRLDSNAALFHSESSDENEHKPAIITSNEDVIRSSSSLASTVPKTITVAPQTALSANIKLCPLVEGKMKAQALAVRIFGGAIVLLELGSDATAEKMPVCKPDPKQITVLQKLSSLDIKATLTNGTEVTSDNPLDIFRGEKRFVRLRIRNLSSSKITYGKLEVDCSPGITSIIVPELSKAQNTIQSLSSGSHIDLNVEVVGNRQGNGWVAMVVSHSSSEKSFIRESRLKLQVQVRDALDVQEMIVPPLNISDKGRELTELTNRVSAPLKLTITSRSSTSTVTDSGGEISTVLPILEYGASMSLPAPSWASYEDNTRMQKIHWYAIGWGREGTIPLSSFRHGPALKKDSKMKLYLEVGYCDQKEGQVQTCVVQGARLKDREILVGQFYRCELKVDGIEKHEGGFVDIRICQKDGNNTMKMTSCVDTVGPTERIPVSDIVLGIVLLLRWNSEGNYYIEATLHSENAYPSRIQASESDTLGASKRLQSDTTDLTTSCSGNTVVDGNAGGSNQENLRLAESISKKAGSGVTLVAHIGQMDPPRNTHKISSSFVSITVKS